MYWHEVSTTTDFCSLARTKYSNSLAHCEIYILIACMALRVMAYMKLYQTTEEDIAYDHDAAVPKSVKMRKGVRVVSQ